MATATARTRSRALSSEEKVRLGLLALPTLALALAITMVSTYLSEVTRRYTQNMALIGLIIGSEGVMALWIPLLAGTWSDQLRTRIGGRLPFVIAGAAPAAVAVALIGFVGSLGAVAIVAALFFGFYFVAYEPYRAMYPDLIDEEQVAGRARGAGPSGARGREAVVDPNESPMPAKITPDQAKALGEALARGKEHRRRIGLTIGRQLIDEQTFSASPYGFTGRVREKLSGAIAPDGDEG